jgi:hypothetical protein
MSAHMRPRGRASASFAAACLALAVLGGCATAPSPQPAPPSPPTPPGPDPVLAAFDRLAQRYLDETYALSPVAATLLGDHRHDARLDDVSAAGYAARAALARELLVAARAIHTARLDRQRQVDHAMLVAALEETLWRIDTFEDWRWNPLLATGIAGNALYGLVARDFAPLPGRLANAGARLEALPAFLAQVRESLDAARVPRVHAETAARQNAGLVTLIDTLLVPRFAELPDADREPLLAAAGRAKSALAQHQLWLERRLVPSAQGDFRIGAARYDEALHHAIGGVFGRAELKTRAEAALVRTRAEMYEIAREVLRDRPRAPLLPDAPGPAQQQNAIAAALELAYADRPARGEVFEAVRSTLDTTRAFVAAKDLVTLYDDPLEVIAMPEFQRGVALAYCDPPGPLETGQRTFYAISPIPDDWTRRQVDSFLREYNNRSIHNLTIHEAMPGHYLQLAHANRYPSRLRAVLRSGTFIEGWAVYAERLMVEQGYLDGDPLMHLVQRKWRLRSIGNTLLDIGVHAEGMTREAAMQLMRRDTFQEEREAAGKWVRAQLTAAQLPTYFVGSEEHDALRAEAEGRWGAEFSLRRFHDAVLAHGSPPARHVRALIFDLPVTP